MVLKDITLSESVISKKYWYDNTFEFHGYDKKVCATLNINGHDILKRVNNPNFKSATLTKVSGGHHQKKVFQNNKCRKLTPIEYERLQGFPDNYTGGVSDTARYCMLGDGWTIPVISHIFSYLPDDWRAIK